MTGRISLIKLSINQGPLYFFMISVDDVSGEHGVEGNFKKNGNVPNTSSF